MAYEAEVRVIEVAIESLKAESPALFGRLESEQRAAATGLEYYGITKSVFESLLDEGSLSSVTAIRLKSGVEAARRMFIS